jgi:hypothetical protein
VNPRDRERRFRRLKEMGCIACWYERVAGPSGYPEIHHLNEGGKGGQKRRGDEYTIPLCVWHHRGVPYGTIPAKSMELTYGPSLARRSCAFRSRYGSDDQLLRLVNRRIEAADRRARGESLLPEAEVSP